MQRWFKLKFVLFGVIFGLMAILFSEKNTQGMPQAISLIGDFSKWFITVPGKGIAILVACLFVYQQICFWKKSTEKREAIKPVAKDIVLVIGGIIFAVLLIGFINFKLGVVA